jgi:hypothetical protein
MKQPGHAMLCAILAAAAYACGGGGGTGGDADADAESDSPADEVSCDGCLVDGECRADGENKPGDPCLVCDPGRSPGGWSPADGAACDDGVFCNGQDSCLAGECSENEGDPCTGDGLFCNGVETCDEVIDACLHPGDPCVDDGLFCNGDAVCDEDADECAQTEDPCSGDEVCFEMEDRCCAPRAELGCNAHGDVAWYDSCGHEQDPVRDCPDVPDGFCEHGVCGCLPGWTGPECSTCVRYVDAEHGDDANLGTSWFVALATIQAGMEAALDMGCQVWVRSGTYLPTDDGDRDASFVLLPGAVLLGGFDGTEITPDQRDLAAHPTVLSGDIGTPGDEDNSRTVVTGAPGAVLDGFTVTGARGRSGLYCDDAAMTVRGCVFEDNHSSSGGGAIFSYPAPITIEDSEFHANASSGSGGAVYVALDGTHPGVGTAIRRSHFLDNHADDDGGAIRYENAFDGSGPELVVDGCVFAGNSASGTGGAMDVTTTLVSDATLLVSGSTFAFNSAGTAGGAMAYRISGDGNAVVASSSIVWGNDAPSDPQIHIDAVFTADLTFRYCNVQDAGYDGTAGNVSADPLFVQGDPDAGPLDLHLGAGSPCIDAGEDDAVGETDVEGNPRFDDPATDNCAAAGDPACGFISDMGAYEYQG